MDKQLAGFAIEFLKRAQLTGEEVPAFNQVMGALLNIAFPPDTSVSEDV